MAAISPTPPIPIAPAASFADLAPLRRSEVQTQRPTEESSRGENERDQDVVVIENRERDRRARKAAEDERDDQQRIDDRKLDIRV
jgi:hypothetical protein